MPHVESLPWRELARHLKLWLGSMANAQAAGNARQILKLMEALVTFMQSNSGTFLRTLMANLDIRESLQQQGATKQFIDTFMEVLQVADLGSSKVLSFGTPAVPISTQLHRHRQEQPPRGRSTTRQLLTSSRPHSLPPLVRTGTVGPVPEAATGDLAVALVSGERGIEAVSSVEPFRLGNSISVAPESLPPEVSSALTQERAVPFVVFNWLTAFYIEVLFCIQYGDMTYVLSRKIVYVAMKAGTQLEGTPALPTCEKDLITGSAPLPWHCVAGLLEASAEMMQAYM